MTEFQYLNGGNTEAQDRLATSFLLAQVSTGLAATGVFTGLAVAQTGTASAAVLVSAGAGVSQDTVGNGAAVMVNDTQKTLDILTGNPMGGTPRNDIVVFDSATTSIRAIIGTPNASPTDPTVPTTAIPLARVRNVASATTIDTAHIDDLRSLTSLFPDLTKLGVTSSMTSKRVHRASFPSPSNTDSNGFLTVSHGAGFTPTLVTVHGVSPGSTFAQPWGTDTYTSTQVRIRFHDVRPSAPSSGAYVSAAPGAFYILCWE